MRNFASKHFSRFHTLLLLKAKLLPSFFTNPYVTFAHLLFQSVLPTISMAVQSSEIQGIP